MRRENESATEFIQRIEATIADWSAKDAREYLRSEARQCRTEAAGLRTEAAGLREEAERLREEAARCEAHVKRLTLVRDIMEIYGERLVPANALRLRDRLLNPVGSSIANNASLPGSMHQAVHRDLAAGQVVIWRADIFAAAIKGHEVFQGRKLSREIRAGHILPQWWFIDQPAPSLDAFQKLWIPFAYYTVSSVIRGAGHVMTILPVGFQRDSEDLDSLDDLAVTANTLGGLKWDAEITEHYSMPVAALRFMEMEFVGMERHVHPRHLRRAAELGRRPALPEVNTITLRRTYHDPDAKGSGEPRDYSCQWLVNAHWRKPSPLYKSQEPVYVRPYVKGPEGAPMREPRDTIYAVRR